MHLKDSSGVDLSSLPTDFSSKFSHNCGEGCVLSDFVSPDPWSAPELVFEFTAPSSAGTYTIELEYEDTVFSGELTVLPVVDYTESTLVVSPDSLFSGHEVFIIFVPKHDGGFYDSSDSLPLFFFPSISLELSQGTMTDLTLLSSTDHTYSYSATLTSSATVDGVVSVFYDESTTNLSDSVKIIKRVDMSAEGTLSVSPDLIGSGMDVNLSLTLVDDSGDAITDLPSDFFDSLVISQAETGEDDWSVISVSLSDDSVLPSSIIFDAFSAPSYANDFTIKASYKDMSVSVEYTTVDLPSNSYSTFTVKPVPSFVNEKFSFVFVPKTGSGASIPIVPTDFFDSLVLSVTKTDDASADEVVIEMLNPSVSSDAGLELIGSIDGRTIAGSYKFRLKYYDRFEVQADVSVVNLIDFDLSALSVFPNPVFAEFSMVVTFVPKDEDGNGFSELPAEFTNGKSLKTCINDVCTPLAYSTVSSDVSNLQYSSVAPNMSGVHSLCIVYEDDEKCVDLEILSAADFSQSVLNATPATVFSEHPLDVSFVLNDFTGNVVDELPEHFTSELSFGFVSDSSLTPSEFIDFTVTQSDWESEKELRFSMNSPEVEVHSDLYLIAMYDGISVNTGIRVVVKPDFSSSNISVDHVIAFESESNATYFTPKCANGVIFEPSSDFYSLLTIQSANSEWLAGDRSIDANNNIEWDSTNPSTDVLSLVHTITITYLTNSTSIDVRIVPEVEFVSDFITLSPSVVFRNALLSFVFAPRFEDEIYEYFPEYFSDNLGFVIVGDETISISPSCDDNLTENTLGSISCDVTVPTSVSLGDNSLVAIYSSVNTQSSADVRVIEPIDSSSSTFEATPSTVFAGRDVLITLVMKDGEGNELTELPSDFKICSDSSSCQLQLLREDANGNVIDALIASKIHDPVSTFQFTVTAPTTTGSYEYRVEYKDFVFSDSVTVVPAIDFGQEGVFEASPRYVFAGSAIELTLNMKNSSGGYLTKISSDFEDGISFSIKYNGIESPLTAPDLEADINNTIPTFVYSFAAPEVSGDYVIIMSYDGDTLSDTISVVPPVSFDDSLFVVSPTTVIANYPTTMVFTPLDAEGNALQAVASDFHVGMVFIEVEVDEDGNEIGDRNEIPSGDVVLTQNNLPENIVFTSVAPSNTSSEQKLFNIIVEYKESSLDDCITVIPSSTTADFDIFLEISDTVVFEDHWINVVFTPRTEDSDGNLSIPSMLPTDISQATEEDGESIIGDFPLLFYYSINDTETTFLDVEMMLDDTTNHIYKYRFLAPSTTDGTTFQIDVFAEYGGKKRSDSTELTIIKTIDFSQSVLTISPEISLVSGAVEMVFEPKSSEGEYLTEFPSRFIERIVESFEYSLDDSSQAPADYLVSLESDELETSSPRILMSGFAPSLKGKYTIGLTYDMDYVSVSLISTHSVDLSQSILSVSPSAQYPTKIVSLTLQPRDSDGNAVTDVLDGYADSLAFTVGNETYGFSSIEFIETVDSLPSKITYTFYTSSVSDEYTVTASDFFDTTGSVDFTVKPDPVNCENSYVIFPDYIMRNIEYTPTIILKDTYNNLISGEASASLLFSVAYQCPGETEIPVGSTGSVPNFTCENRGDLVFVLTVSTPETDEGTCSYTSDSIPVAEEFDYTFTDLEIAPIIVAYEDNVTFTMQLRDVGDIDLHPTQIPSAFISNVIGSIRTSEQTIEESEDLVLTFVSLDETLFTFNASLTVVGTYIIDLSYASEIVSTSEFEIIPGDLSCSLSSLTLGVSQAAGISFSPTLDVRDSFDNIIEIETLDVCDIDYKCPMDSNYSSSSELIPSVNCTVSGSGSIQATLTKITQIGSTEKYTTCEWNSNTLVPFTIYPTSPSLTNTVIYMKSLPSNSTFTVDEQFQIGVSVYDDYENDSSSVGTSPVLDVSVNLFKCASKALGGYSGDVPSSYCSSDLVSDTVTHEEGGYVKKFNPKRAGSYRFEVTVRANPFCLINPESCQPSEVFDEFTISEEFIIDSGEFSTFEIVLTDSSFTPLWLPGVGGNIQKMAFDFCYMKLRQLDMYNNIPSKFKESLEAPVTTIVSTFDDDEIIVTVQPYNDVEYNILAVPWGLGLTFPLEDLFVNYGLTAEVNIIVYGYVGGISYEDAIEKFSEMDEESLDSYLDPTYRAESSFSIDMMTMNMGDKGTLTVNSDLWGSYDEMDLEIPFPTAQNENLGTIKLIQGNSTVGQDTVTSGTFENIDQ
ncbi:hypothetical protein ADUPG1_011388, partial [Aduncisulcus paluster]